MKVIVESNLFMVFDDFLSKEEFNLVWNYFQVEAFFRVDSAGQNGKWLIEDGASLRGPTIGYKTKWHAQYPTNTAIDKVMEAVFNNEESFSKVIGRFKTHWSDFTAFATLYPVGCGLHWHRDATVNAGSYVFYGHPDWNVEWGGETLLGDESLLKLPAENGIFMSKPAEVQGLPKKIALNTHLDNRDANAAIMDHGAGSYVIPKPNRLVVIHGGLPHKVCKVAPAAGSKVRASIGGFFKRSE